MALSSEERALISRASKRDPEAFSELYLRFYDRVLRRVLVIVKDPYDAEDITSEAFLRAWNSISKFEARDVSILAWFCTIAEHLALKYVSKQRPCVDVDDVVIHARKDSNPITLVERKSDIAVLDSAIARLPVDQQEVISRHFIEELSYTELGEVTGRPVGTIRVIQHRALKALRTMLTSREEMGLPRRPATH